MRVFASGASLAFVVASVVSPHAAPPAEAQPARFLVAAQSFVQGQSFALDDDESPAVGRDDYDVSRLSTAPAVGLPDPGTAQAIAYEMVLARGWGQSEYECLVALWERESHWNVYAHNAGSGAYGIPQALPGVKMATAGADWATNPATQITWGLGYIAARYGTPCGAWESSEARGWY